MSNKTESSVDRVYFSLKEKIELHEWIPGDRIPSENDLAEQYGVSRLTIRAALQKLVALGILETLNGGGTYVKRFDFSSLVQRVSGLMLKNITHDDISIYRELIEVSTIELLKEQKILSSQIKKLKSCCKRMKKYGEILDTEAFAMADYDFHLFLCKMSGNNMFVYAYEMLGPIMLEYFRLHYDLQAYARKTGIFISGQEAFTSAVEYHEQIVEALERRDFEKCIRIIKAMSTSTPLEL